MNNPINFQKIQRILFNQISLWIFFVVKKKLFDRSKIDLSEFISIVSILDTLDIISLRSKIELSPKIFSEFKI